MSVARTFAPAVGGALWESSAALNLVSGSFLGEAPSPKDKPLSMGEG
jgi:hypothetical protein